MESLLAAARNSIKTAVRLLNRSVNPEDAKAMLTYAEAAKEYADAYNARHTLPRVRPIREHKIDDLADFYIDEGWFSIGCPYARELGNLEHEQRVVFMRRLRIMIAEAVGKPIKRPPDGWLPMPSEPETGIKLAPSKPVSPSKKRRARK